MRMGCLVVRGKAFVLIMLTMQSGAPVAYKRAAHRCFCTLVMKSSWCCMAAARRAGTPVGNAQSDLLRATAQELAPAPSARDELTRCYCLRGKDAPGRSAVPNRARAQRQHARNAARVPVGAETTEISPCGPRRSKSCFVRSCTCRPAPSRSWLPGAAAGEFSWDVQAERERPTSFRERYADMPPALVSANEPTSD